MKIRKKTKFTSYNLDILNSWDNIALVIKSELSTSIQNKTEMSGKVKICIKVTVIFSKLKESC